jgi:AraC family transcriptional activator of pobA
MNRYNKLIYKIVDENRTYKHQNKLEVNADFELITYDTNSILEIIQKNNYYSILVIEKGIGKIKLDFSEFSFKEQSILFFPISQSYKIIKDGDIKGFSIHFNAEILSVKKLQREIPDVKVLFSSCYSPSILKLNTNEETNIFLSVITILKKELLLEKKSKKENLSSNLKNLISNASQLKTLRNSQAITYLKGIKVPFKIQYLIDTIEHNFRTNHNPEFYSDFFEISYEILNLICTENLKKTLLDLIFERILIESNRELYITSKSTKEIAIELGFQCEEHFITFFESRTGLTPISFRKTIGNIQ